jgi:effector-binding domain-containing protein
MGREIKEVSYKPKKYLAWKKEITTGEITNQVMYEEGFQKIFGYVKNNRLKTLGPCTLLYFKWDEPEGYASIALAVPVEDIETVNEPELSLVNIPESKAALAALYGSYNGLKTLHESLMAYCELHRFKITLTVEEYTIDRLQELNPANWVTNVYYLHN